MTKLNWVTAAAVSALLPAGGAVAAGGAPADELHLVPMAEITVPIIDGDRLEGQLRVKLMLDTGSSRLARDVKTAMPELRFASIAAASEFSRLYASGFRAVDVERLSADLDAALRRQNPGIKRVLIVEVAATPA